jgi:hypothetical protein
MFSLDIYATWYGDERINHWVCQSFYVGVCSLYAGKFTLKCIGCEDMFLLEKMHNLVCCSSDQTPVQENCLFDFLNVNKKNGFEKLSLSIYCFLMWLEHQPLVKPNTQKSKTKKQSGCFFFVYNRMFFCLQSGYFVIWKPKIRFLVLKCLSFSFIIDVFGDYHGSSLPWPFFFFSVECLIGFCFLPVKAGQYLPVSSVRGLL